jgi:hypothetical protein
MEKMMSNQEISIHQHNQGFMQVSTLEQAMICADIISKSSLCPKGMIGKPSDIVLSLQMGQELGLKPMQALQNIAVINGRPSLWGDAMLAVCRQSPNFEYITEKYLEEKETYICRVKRRNEPEFTQSFSKKDAIVAKLWNKTGPWTDYPKRMLQMRARGFCLRDAFPDLLRGIITTEEAMDITIDRTDYSNLGITVESKVEDRKTIVDKLSLEVLIQKMKEANTKDIDLCQIFEIESLEAMNMEQYKVAINMTEKKISKKRKLNELEINKIISKESNKDVTLEELFGDNQENLS